MFPIPSIDSEPNSNSQSAPAPVSSAELHLLYVLLDSNLPTGGFVSSSGLESYAKHGFFTPSAPSYSDPDVHTTNGAASGRRSVAQGVTEFAWAEVGNYASTTGGFVGDAWSIVDSVMRGYRGAKGSMESEGKGKGRAGPDGISIQGEDGRESEIEMEMEDMLGQAVKRIQKLDQYHESTLLSHVGRRSSRAQGVAMLTLFSRGLSRPPGLDWRTARSDTLAGCGPDADQGPDEIAQRIVERYKRLIRLGEAPGHLAVCWGVMTAALGLSLARAIHIHLFLHARSLLSSAVRLNLIGPYLSSQLLLHPFKRIIEAHTASLEGECSTCLVDAHGEGAGAENGGSIPPVDDDSFWDWTYEAERGPCTTWPLGEVLMGRHDLQHSRIFNS